MRDHTLLFFGVNVFFFILLQIFTRVVFYIDLHFDFMNDFWLAFMWSLCLCVGCGGGVFSVPFILFLYVCLFVGVHNFMFVWECVGGWVCVCLKGLSSGVLCISKYMCVIIENKSWRFYVEDWMESNQIRVIAVWIELHFIRFSLSHLSNFMHFE